jgi:hypothetical protein
MLASLSCTGRLLDVGSTARGLALSCLRVLTTLLGPAVGGAAPAPPSGHAQQQQQQQRRVAPAALAALRALAPAAGTEASGSEGVALVRRREGGLVCASAAMLRALAGPRCSLLLGA